MYRLSASCLCFWCFYMWSYGRQCPDDYFGHKVWKLWMTRQFLTRDLFLLTQWQETASEQLTPCIGIHVTCYLIQLASTCFCWKVSCVTEALSYGRQCPDDYFGHEVWKLRMTRQFLSRDPLLFAGLCDYWFSRLMYLYAWPGKWCHACRYNAQPTDPTSSTVFHSKLVHTILDNRCQSAKCVIWQLSAQLTCCVFD